MIRVAAAAFAFVLLTVPCMVRAADAATSGRYADETSAKAHCPADTVVWANTESKVWHLAGTKSYGTTKNGAYMCEKDATAAGFHATKAKHTGAKVKQ